MPESFAERESRERAEARAQRTADRRLARRLAERTQVTIGPGDRVTVTTTVTTIDPGVEVELVETGPPSPGAAFAPEDVSQTVELVFEEEPTVAMPAAGTVTTYPTHSAAMCENCEELIVLFDGYEWDHVDTAEELCQP
jgi:hypothetical protein